MEDLQAVPEHDAAEPPEPRPVFEGDWQTATGVEKGQHSERVRQWKVRQGLKRQRPMGTGTEQPVSSLRPDAASDPANRQVLQDIRDDPRALSSDRIRATQALLQLDRGAEDVGAQASDLVTLRAILDTLQPEERLAWLQGERVDALRA